MIKLLIFLIVVAASLADVYEDDIPPPPPPPPPPPRPRYRPSFHKHYHEHLHLPPNYIVQSPGYYSYGGYPGYGVGGYYPTTSYGYGGFWPGVGGWSNPLGTGSSWAAGGGVVGNALSFLIG